MSGGNNPKITQRTRDRRKKRKRCDPRNIKLVKGLAQGLSKEEALKKAGLSHKNPSQSAYQAIKQVERYAPDVLDEFGMTLDSLVRDLLKPMCYAEETKF